MKTRYSSLLVFVVASWIGQGQSWGGGRRAEDRAHVAAWEALSADLSRGDCTMDSLSEQASVTLPIGQTVSKDEYRLACESSMGDTTVGKISFKDERVVTIDRSNFSVEAVVTTEAISLKLAEVRMYSQNIALLAARGYTMVPSSSFEPVIRPA